MEQYSLIGLDGNVFNIIGYVLEAMRKTRFSVEERNKFRDECFATHSYDLILQKCLEKIDEINAKLVRN